MVFFMVAIIILALLLSFSLLLPFISQLKLIKKYSSKFWFVLFLISMILFFIIRLVLILLSPDLNPIYTSKFEGNSDYFILLILNLIASFIFFNGFGFFIMIGASFVKLKKLNFMIGIPILLISFIVVLLMPNIDSIFYSSIVGWTYIMDPIVIYYNIFMFGILIFYIIFLLNQKNKIKNKTILEKYNNFLLGSGIILFGSSFSIIIVEQLIGQIGIRIISIIVGILFISNSFKS